MRASDTASSGIGSRVGWPCTTCSATITASIRSAAPSAAASWSPRLRRSRTGRRPALARYAGQGGPRALAVQTKQVQGSLRRPGPVGVRAGLRCQPRCAAGSSSSMSFGDGILRSSDLEIFHACCTTQLSERSSRWACCWISLSMSSGKYRLCLRASLADMLFALLALCAVLGDEDVDHRGEAHDLVARDLPRLLHDPRERTVLPVRLLLDFAQHVLGEVEALLSLVSARHQHPPGASAAA